MTWAPASLAEEAQLARDRSAEDFANGLRAQITAAVGEEAAAAFLQAAPPDQIFLGLERYWRKRAEREAA